MTWKKALKVLVAKSFNDLPGASGMGPDFSDKIAEDEESRIDKLEFEATLEAVQVSNPGLALIMERKRSEKGTICGGVGLNWDAFPVAELVFFVKRGSIRDQPNLHNHSVVVRRQGWETEDG